MFDKTLIIVSGVGAGLYSVVTPVEPDKIPVETVMASPVGDRELVPLFEIREIALDETTGPIGRYLPAGVADWSNY